jgi:hypothetical protein
MFHYTPPKASLWGTEKNAARARNQRRDSRAAPSIYIAGTLPKRSDRDRVSQPGDATDEPLFARSVNREIVNSTESNRNVENNVKALDYGHEDDQFFHPSRDYSELQFFS